MEEYTEKHPWRHSQSAELICHSNVRRFDYDCAIIKYQPHFLKQRCVSTERPSKKYNVNSYSLSKL